MSAAPWMEIAWEQEGAGVEEIGGKAAHGSIIQYFHDIKRPDITSDEIPWCAAFYFWCLQRAGVSIDAVPQDQRLLASSATLLGTRIDAPRVGAARVSKRFDKRGKVIGHHVAFVTGWTASRVKLLGGNQSNSVCEAEFKRRSDDVYIWPPAPVSVQEVAQVSRIADAAGDVRTDAVKTGGTQGIEQIIPAPPDQLPGVDALLQHAGIFKSTVAGTHDFLLFGWSKVWWVALALSAYWLLRMAWNAGWIRWWRAEDANTGKAPLVAAADSPAGSRPPTPEVDVPDSEGWEQ